MNSYYSQFREVVHSQLEKRCKLYLPHISNIESNCIQLQNAEETIESMKLPNEIKKYLSWLVEHDSRYDSENIYNNNNELVNELLNSVEINRIRRRVELEFYNELNESTINIESSCNIIQFNGDANEENSRL